MAETKVNPTTTSADTLENVQVAFEKNQKLIIGVASAVLVVFVAYVAFFHWYVPQQEVEAQKQLFKAVTYFENDNYEQALNGDGNFPGMLAISNKYKFTKAANLSHYYAGISYLNTGKFQEAIDQLKKFSSDDKVLGTLALGAIGDAYFELNNASEGISYYKKAVANQPNEFTTPVYLLRLALAQENAGDKDAAIKNLNLLKNEYPTTQEGRNAEKYLARLGQ
jgi:tetratricopeptide (TPR) repeat protein